MLIRFLASAVAISVATFLVPGVSLTAGSTQAEVIAMLCVAVIFELSTPSSSRCSAGRRTPDPDHHGSVPPGDQRRADAADLMVAGQFHLGWHVAGWGPAFWGALIVSIVSFVLHAFVGGKGEGRRNAGYWTGRRKSFWR